MGVVVTNKSKMASYFPGAGNLNGSDTEICFDVAGPSSSGSGNLEDHSESSNKMSETLNRDTSGWTSSLACLPKFENKQLELAR